MKNILIVACLVLPLALTQAEEIKVYPKGVSQAEMKMHGRARTKARIHQITRSGIFSGLTEVEKDKVRREAMPPRKHNWSTTEKEKKHKMSQEVRCNGDVRNNKGKAAIGEHKSKKSAKKETKCKTKF